MRKSDLILIGVIMCACLGLLIPLFSNHSQPSVAVVSVRNEEKMRIDLSVDGEYEVEGTNGPVHIVVKDGAVAVTQENSPHHYCSRQGYVSSVNTPVVCLPNETVVTIEGPDEEADTVVS